MSDGTPSAYPTVKVFVVAMFNIITFQLLILYLYNGMEKTNHLYEQKIRTYTSKCIQNK
jgi:hypothetical protein